MLLDYLHNHPNFPDLIRILSHEKKISSFLIEKDYWIMHCLYGLQKLDLEFFMKGGTSLSKGYQLIDRFSEDIDILITPLSSMKVASGPNQNKPHHCKSRLEFYNWLSTILKIEGIIQVERDTAFDDKEKYRSGGIRLIYKNVHKTPEDIKEGILLEVGFDAIASNEPKNISSWAYDFAREKVDIIDNRATNVLCYHPGYTLVEKLQTISTKFRKQQENKEFSKNFMRHYYDVYCLLKDPSILKFIGSQEYHAHKKKRFRKADILDINLNEAFILQDNILKVQYEKQYNQTQSLYYDSKPSFEKIMTQIRRFAPIL